MDVLPKIGGIIPGQILLAMKKAYSLIRLGALVWYWLLIIGKRKCGASTLLVSYGHTKVPRSTEQSAGGMVKLQPLRRTFQESRTRFNILYLVSSSLPRDWKQLVWLAKRRGTRIVWNQNGIAYRGCYGHNWEKLNVPMKNGLHSADYILYQSKFCKEGADAFLGINDVPSEILYNAVDTDLFFPAVGMPDNMPLTLLLAGTQYHFYRVQTAIMTLANLIDMGVNSRLLIAGRLTWYNDRKSLRMVKELVEELAVCHSVELLGSYAQSEAPTIYQRAHILLHTKYNDPCPTVVLEGMACGLPVVYSHSGGVPELVGPDAGIGVPAVKSWDQDYPPDPKLLAEAVLEVAEKQGDLSVAARQRVVDKFPLNAWLRRHKEIFEKVLSLTI